MLNEGEMISKLVKQLLQICRLHLPKRKQPAHFQVWVLIDVQREQLFCPAKWRVAIQDGGDDLIRKRYPLLIRQQFPHPLEDHPHEVPLAAIVRSLDQFLRRCSEGEVKRAGSSFHLQGEGMFNAELLRRRGQNPLLRG